MAKLILDGRYPGVHLRYERNYAETARDAWQKTASCWDVHLAYKERSTTFLVWTGPEAGEPTIEAMIGCLSI